MRGVGLFGCGVWVCIVSVGFGVGDGRRWLDFAPVPIHAAVRCPGVGGHLPPAICCASRTKYGLCKTTQATSNRRASSYTRYGPQAPYTGE